MARTLIQAIGGDAPQTLPLPYGGTLLPGKGTIVADSEATVILNLGGAGALGGCWLVRGLADAAAPLGPYTPTTGAASVVAALAATATAVDFNSQKITGLGTPSAATDASTKTYVDTTVAAASVETKETKNPCHLATAASLASYSRTDNVITLTATGTLTVDGVVTALNDRLLLLDAHVAAPADAGIYYVTTAGAPGVAAVLTRATDADSSAKVTHGMNCRIEAGSTQAGKAWYLSTANTITLNSTSLAFTRLDYTPATTAEVRSELARFEAPITAELVTIVADAALATGTSVRTLTAGATAGTLPDYPRGLAVRLTIDTTHAITAGTIDIVGTGPSGEAVTESVSAITAVSATVNTLHAFSSITSITATGITATGGAGSNSLSAGVSALLGLPASQTRTNSAFAGIAEYNASGIGVALARVAIGTVNATYGTWIPTNAPNATRIHMLRYSYSVGHTHALA